MGKTAVSTQKTREELKLFFFNFAYRQPRSQGVASPEDLERMRDVLTVTVEARTYRGAQVKAKQRQRLYSGWQVAWDLVDVFWVPAAASHGAVRRPVRVSYPKHQHTSFDWQLLRDNNSTHDG